MKLQLQQVWVRKTIEEIGYNNGDYGFDGNTCPSSTLTQSSVVSSMVLDDFNIPGFISMSNIALRKFGGSAIRTTEPYGKPMDFLQTAENIISARPLAAVLKWDLLSGHMAVISGFSIDENIRIIDPWDNSKTIYAPYAQALNGYQI